MSRISKFTSREDAGLPIVRTRKQGRILLVEPDTNLHDNLKFLLGSQGYDVFIAADIAKAYSLSRFKGFAFILFNWFMEREAGLELCKYIRAMNRATPVFFYTAQGHENRLDNHLEAMVQNYNVKPIETNVILKTIFLHLEKQRITPSATDELL
jgi:two-component system, OmpR family, response regulator VicR